MNRLTLFKAAMLFSAPILGGCFEHHTTETKCFPDGSMASSDVWLTSGFTESVQHCRYSVKLPGSNVAELVAETIEGPVSFRENPNVSIGQSEYMKWFLLGGNFYFGFKAENPAAGGEIRDWIRSSVNEMSTRSLAAMTKRGGWNLWRLRNSDELAGFVISYLQAHDTPFQVVRGVIIDSEYNERDLPDSRPKWTVGTGYAPGYFPYILDHYDSASKTLFVRCRTRGLELPNWLVYVCTSGFVGDWQLDELGSWIESDVHPLDLTPEEKRVRKMIEDNEKLYAKRRYQHRQTRR